MYSFDGLAALMRLRECLITRSPTYDKPRMAFVRFGTAAIRG